MERSSSRFEKYWDRQVLRFIPPYARFRKVEAEIKEHFSFLSVMIERILLPVVVLYVILGFAINVNLFAPLFLSLIVFFYSNFLPDIDFLVKQTDSKEEESLWYEKYFVLFFAPIVLYYVFVGRAKPVRSEHHRCFHNVKSLILYTVFLFILANIFWDTNVKISILPVFGFLGYAFHLAVDGTLSLRIFKRKKD